MLKNSRKGATKVINLKQMELAKFLLEQQQYPEIELVEIVESGVYPSHLWVQMNMPEDEDRMIEMEEVAANISCEYRCELRIKNEKCRINKPNSMARQT
jgi:hypothetical protein